MADRGEFSGYILELLTPLGRVASRRMFGGFGLYCDGLFFAILMDDVLYLKADDQTRHKFEDAGCELFTYERNAKPASLNYYRVPDEALESPALLLPWARLALEAALRKANALGKNPAKTATTRKPSFRRKPESSRR